MKIVHTAIALSLAAATAPALADGIPHLDHAFVILMENRQYDQIIGNPSAPFINQYARQANLARNYYGIGHPSLTNYLEIVGGSNFGVRNDNAPDWHDTTCTPNIASGSAALEGAPPICPIRGSGTDAATPALDTNEGDGLNNLPFAVAAAPTVGETIADQLDVAGLSWKSYQESLPVSGPDGVNYSDGLLTQPGNPQFGYMPKLYAVKHNPFAYFASVQEHGLRNLVDFSRLYADLRSGHVPNFAFIAPNQCHDQHGRGSGEVSAGCSLDANVIAQGDAALKDVIDAIKASPAWQRGNNAIVVVWDENDYSPANDNRVVTIVDTNYGVHGVTSNVLYSHFSLLKTLEAGFGLPYLNHAADSNIPLMSDLFAGTSPGQGWHGRGQ